MRGRGFVLPAMLFGLLLLSAIVVGAFFAAWQSVRLARAAAGEHAARLAAAGAIADQFASWDATLDSLPAGSAVAIPIPGGTSLRVERASLNIFSLVAAARDSLSGATRSLQAVGRLKPLLLRPAATARLREDPGTLTPSIGGTDTNPPGWNCAGAPYSITPVTIQLYDTNNTFYVMPEGWTWSTLVQWVTALPPGGDSLPWIVTAADTVLAGGRFTGVLIVNGDVVLRGGAEVVGAIIARGSIAFEGLGAAIFGAVVARALAVSPGTPASAARVDFSSCALRLAGRSRAPVLPLPGLPFADYY